MADSYFMLSANHKPSPTGLQLGEGSTCIVRMEWHDVHGDTDRLLHLLELQATHRYCLATDTAKHPCAAICCQCLPVSTILEGSGDCSDRAVAHHLLPLRRTPMHDLHQCIATKTSLRQSYRRPSRDESFINSCFIFLTFSQPLLKPYQ